MDERYCTECRAEIPKGESVCPSCGVYAGDVFDGKLPKKKRSHAWWFVPLFILAAVVVYIFAPPVKEKTPVRTIAPLKPHVVKNQTDAMMTLRRFLTTADRSEHCVALIAKGNDGQSYVISAVDSCKHSKLGDFAVDVKTANITKR